MGALGASLLLFCRQHTRQRCSNFRVLVCNASGQPILEVRNLHAKVVGQDREILQGLNLTINAGEVNCTHLS